MTSARHVRRRRLGAGAALALALALSAGLALTGITASAPAVAADDSDLVTTSSTRTVAWAEQNPRHPDDGPTAGDTAPYRALKDLRLRVSQSTDLRNQTVQVSWQGLGSNGKEAFLQLMQCWSDGPDVPPTREQCAYGGIDRAGAEGTGFAKTRQLGTDPRERTYRNDGSLNVVAVDGAVPTRTWAAGAELVLGTNQQRCPSPTAGFTVTLVPPREVVQAGSLPPSIVVQGPTDTPTASLTRTENGFDRTYAAVTAPFRFSSVAAANGIAQWPVGQYRSQLTCNGAGGAELARFVGYLDQVDVEGVRVWRQGTHEGGVFVPFDPLGDTADTAATDPYERDAVLEYVKPRSTNEIWQALRRPDGSGSASMELLSDLEAQHLGCGRVDVARVRSCWLVAVPRWGREPNGTDQETAVLYSPLSQTLWDRRIAVPLAFAPVAAGCRIGSGLKQVLTHDSALNALRSWQPTFCGDANTASSVLGPLQDLSIRAGFRKNNRLGVVTRPPDGEHTVVTAPLVTSAVVVGFAVDRQIAFGNAGFDRNGTRARVLNLTARLVAKLLTQSYDSGAAPNGGKTSGVNSPARSGGFQPTYVPARSFPPDNPRTLYDDPEFRRLNPDFVAWLAQAAALPPLDMADVLVSANDTDAYQTLWQWILGDRPARDFLQGVADPDGMLVNPYYRDQISSSTSSFPLLDPTCVDDIENPAADAFPLLCQLNNHPRVDDDAEAAQAAVRGDTRRVNVPPPLFTGAAGEVLSFQAEPRQQQGKLGMLVITTSSVAERYGLPTARLQNADGRFVPATASSLDAAREQMPSRPDGVLVAAPELVRGEGYPLTTNSYAIVDVAATTQSQNDAFAAVLDYAAGAGQVPGTALGQLPPGYAPLSARLRDQTRAAAALLRDPSSLLPVAVAAPAPAVPPVQVSVPPTPAGPTPPPVASSPAAVVPVAVTAPPSAPARSTPVGSGGTAAAPRVSLDRPPLRSDSGSGAGPAPVPLTAEASPTGGAPVAAAVPSVALAPSVAPVALTRSPVTALRWVVPALVLLALVAGCLGRALPTLRRVPS